MQRRWSAWAGTSRPPKPSGGNALHLPQGAAEPWASISTACRFAALGELGARSGEEMHWPGVGKTCPCCVHIWVP